MTSFDLARRMWTKPEPLEEAIPRGGFPAWTPGALECLALNAQCELCTTHLGTGLARWFAETDRRRCFMPHSVDKLLEEGVEIEKTHRTKAQHVMEVALCQTHPLAQNRQ